MSVNSFKTSLTVALESAGTVICNGFEIDTQIDGGRIGKPNLVMLQCDDVFTVVLPYQEIQIDESGTALCICDGDTPETPRTAITFMMTVPLSQEALLKS